MSIDDNRFNEVKKEYLDLLNANSINYDEEKAKKMKEALKCALDIRKFEIELYWKRATYFWAFIGVIFFAYFSLYNIDSSINYKPMYALGISIVGFIFSFCWYLVNRGSKFWQENWEMHVDFLEDEIMGSLYRVVKNPESYKWHKLLDGYSSSVSKINQFLSLVITSVWIILIYVSIYQFTVVNFEIKINLPIILAFFMTFIILFIIIFLFIKTTSSLKSKENPKHFIKRDFNKNN